MPISGLLAGQGQTGPAFHSPDLFPFCGLAQRFLPVERIRELYRRAHQPTNRSLLENVLSEMRVEYRVSDSDLNRILTSGRIGDLEADGKGIPILIRQYAKLGGRLLSFNADRNFSGVLDGLVLVDMRQTDPGVLARYLGKRECEAFRRYHGLSSFPGEA